MPPIIGEKIVVGWNIGTDGSAEEVCRGLSSAERVSLLGSQGIVIDQRWSWLVVVFGGDVSRTTSVV